MSGQIELDVGACQVACRRGYAAKAWGALIQTTQWVCRATHEARRVQTDGCNRNRRFAVVHRKRNTIGQLTIRPLEPKAAPPGAVKCPART